jgi:hypothetical protein
VAVSLRRAVKRLVAAGQRQYGTGDLAGAIEQHRQACALVRDALEGDPRDRTNLQQLGSMLYTLGEWEFLADEHSAALETLTEAESTYRRLDPLGGPPVGDIATARLVADVVIRRARVNAAAGHPLSAISDAQEAILSCLAGDGGPGDPGRVDTARVMAYAAHVQLVSRGDPDLAVGAADWALREFTAAFRSGTQLRVPEAHVAPLHSAGVVAYVVHSAFGRDELARAAAGLTGLHAAGPQAPGVLDQLRQMAQATAAGYPTLAQVLEAADRPDLRDLLTAPATDVALYVPATRCHPQVAPAHAVTLARLQASAAPDTTGANLLGLEAHALFAAASQARVPSIRYEFGQFGPQWVAALLNFGQRHAEQDEWPAALDAARWLTGVVSQLLPFAAVDPLARRTALDAVRWQQAVYHAVGDTTAADGLAQGIATLERLGRPG